MTTVYDVPADPLIQAVARKLRDVDGIQAPEWAAFAKTGIHREKPPAQADWWEIRVAAVLRRTYTDGPIGSERLRALYGGARDRGSKPDRAKKGSGSIAREALQQLEAAKLVEVVKGEGRRASGAGRKLLDNTAHEVKQTLAEAVPGLAKY